MSSDALQRLTKKKGKQLSKFLGIESVPDTNFIIKIQEKIKNPMFKLSMNDYEMMCGDKTMTKVMTKVFDCDLKQLKKFCKYINVFKDNINSSPESIKKKMKLSNRINASMRRVSLHALPDDILEKIVNKYESLFSRIKYKLKDWIPSKKLDWNMLSLNPNAIELLKADPTEIYWNKLFKNPNPAAIELLKANPHVKIDWRYLSENPSAIELLKANHNKIDWEWLSKNPHPYAIELLKENQDKINWFYLSANPNAIELLKENYEEIDWEQLSENPNAIELLKANLNEIFWPNLSLNPNEGAIELLKENQEKIDWWNLSYNPNPAAIELLKANKTKINWQFLSGNPNPEAIELLKENQKKIDWGYLSGNPAIFDEILE